MEKENLPPIDFSTFVLSLAGSVQIYLGVLPNPETKEQGKNLPLAKQSIDLMALLHEKTKGNLTEDEEKIFENILGNLRMQYVEASK